MNYLWKSSIGAAVLAAAGIWFVAMPQAQDGAGKPKSEEPKPAAPGETPGDPALLAFNGGGSPPAQEAPGKPKPEEPKPAPGGKGGSGPAPFLVEEDGRVKGTDWPVRFRTLADPNVQDKYAAAIAAYRAVPDGQDKESAKATVRKQLAEIFEADMKSRKEQVDQIDARLKKLREQYQAREAAKDSIIDLQLQVLEKDANGLGFPGARTGENPDYVEGLRRYPLLSFPAKLDDGRLIPGESSNIPGRRGQENADPTQKLPLEALKKSQPALIDELTKAGSFVESPDGKFYAYANITRPSGPSEILLVDSPTGKLLSIYTHPSVVGKLLISDTDIVTQEKDGSTTPRIRYSGITPLTRRPAIEGNSSRNSTQNNRSPFPATSEASTPANVPPSETPAQGGAFGEYQSLRNQYLNAKNQLRSEEYIKSELENAKKLLGDKFTEEKAKESVESLKNSAARYQAQFDEVNRLLEVKLRLLKLDVNEAKTKLTTAEAKAQQAMEVGRISPGNVNLGEIESWKSEANAARIQIERAETMLQLFESIKDAASTPIADSAKRPK